MITQQELKEILHYDPDTGIFVWLVGRGNYKCCGKIAGYLRKVGYVQIQIKGKFYYAHRLAFLYMNGKWPKYQADHINSIKNDNRWDNLREASHSENQMNAKKQKNSTSGYKGVSLYKPSKKWHARIGIKGIQKHLGYFNTKEEASEAYKKAAREHHKEFLHKSLKK